MNSLCLMHPSCTPHAPLMHPSCTPHAPLMPLESTNSFINPVIRLFLKNLHRLQTPRCHPASGVSPVSPVTQTRPTSITIADSLLSQSISDFPPPATPTSTTDDRRYPNTVSTLEFPPLVSVTCHLLVDWMSLILIGRLISKPWIWCSPRI